MFIARLTSPRASASGLPSSAVIVRAISSPRRPIISSARNSACARAGAGVSAQPGAAAAAAATARPASSAPDIWKCPSSRSLWAGL